MRLRRRASAANERDPAEEVSTDAWEEAPDAGDAADESGGGWRTSTAGFAGGARVVRVLAWVAIGSGPLLGLVALAGSGGAARPASIAPPVAAAQDTTVGATGFAQLFVAAYLGAGHGTENALTPYFASPVTLSGPPGMRRAVHLATVASREVQAGYWSVTVAAQVSVRTQAGAYVDAGVQFFRVGVQTAAGGAGAAGFTATSLPAQVAAPVTLQPGPLGYGTEQASVSGPAADTAGAFLAAYLAGQGELARYTSPDARLSAVAPAPYAQVRVTAVSSDAPSVSDTAVPGDGSLRQLLVTVDAFDISGTGYPLTYALQLKARGGRWEVVALDDAPLLKPGAPTPAPPSPPATPGTPAPAPTGLASPPVPTSVVTPSAAPPSSKE